MTIPIMVQNYFLSYDYEPTKYDEIVYEGTANVNQHQTI